MYVFLRFLYVSLKAHGLWHLALGRRLSAVSITFWGSRIELLGASPHPIASTQGSLIEPLGAKWPLKAAKEDPKADTERSKVAKAGPDVDHKAPNSEKSPKKISETCSRVSPNHEKAWFSFGFCIFR